MARDASAFGASRLRSRTIRSMTAEAEVRRRIAEKGRIPFAEFMGVALYWPHGGYYSSGGNIAASGDFFTSPLAHPTFGALIAVQLYQMWLALDRPESFTVVEPGSANGLLCRDILTFSDTLPDGFKDALRYLCVDLRAFPGHEKGIASASRLVAESLPVRGVTGCILSNELLDAFPVHQITMEGGRLREALVTLKDGKLALTTGEPSTPALAERLDGLGITLAEGQTAEVNLGLAVWAAEVAAALDRGFVLTIDYGRSARELYSPEERFRGTLTTFYQHVQTDSPLQRIGRQDITSQVDFTSVVRLGQRAGLEFLDITDQRSFLKNLGLEEMLRRLRAVTTDQTEFAANRRGMLELLKPDGLGNFKVLAQGKNVGKAGLSGFEPSEDARKLVANLPPPTLTSRHLNLGEGTHSGLPPTARDYPGSGTSLQ